MFVKAFNQHEEDKPHVLLLGGLNGDSPVGTEVLVRLTRHLITGEELHNSRAVHAKFTIRKDRENKLAEKSKIRGQSKINYTWTHFFIFSCPVF